MWEKGTSALNLSADMSLMIQLVMDLKEMRPWVFTLCRDDLLLRKEFA